MAVTPGVVRLLLRTAGIRERDYRNEFEKLFGPAEKKPGRRLVRFGRILKRMLTRSRTRGGRA